nr:GAF domain-containing protein [Dictyobacter kobayashii]
MLDCSITGLVAVEGSEGSMHIVGASGLSQERLAYIQQEVERSTLSDYLEPATIAQLQANQVVILDLATQPFVRRSNYGLQYFLLAPMLLDGQLVGIFGIDRPAEQEYVQEEIELVKALAKMAALVIERVRLLQAWAQTRANELALQEANRRFDGFLSLASHELRTPLTGIRGLIELVLRRLGKLARDESIASLLTGPTLNRLRHPLEEAVQRAAAQNRMISDMLDASRIQANQLEMLTGPAICWKSSGALSPMPTILHPVTISWSDGLQSRAFPSSPMLIASGKW